MFYIIERKTGKYLISCEDCIRLTEDKNEKIKKFKSKREANRYIKENYLSEFIVVDD